MCQQISEIRRAIAAFGSEFTRLPALGLAGAERGADTAAIVSIAANRKALASARARRNQRLAGIRPPISLRGSVPADGHSGGLG